MKENDDLNASSSQDGSSVHTPSLSELLKNAQMEKASIENVGQKEQKNVKVKGVIGNKQDSFDLSPDVQIGADAAPSELLKDIISINPSEILSPLLWTQSSCFHKLEPDKILVFQRKEINSPLLKTEDSYEYEAAKQLFRNLLSYMDDRKSSKSPQSHAKKFLRIILTCSSDLLRDEAYLQVYKQLHSNPRHNSIMRGWKMMAIISSCFVPKNVDIYHIMLNYLFFEMQNSNEPSIVNHCKYIFVRMIKTREKERRYVPSDEELYNIERLTSIELPVKFFTGNQTMVNVESYTTVRTLKDELMKRLDLNSQKGIYYSLYEICDKKAGREERFIDDSEKVCDVLAIWNIEIDRDNKKGEKTRFEFYLKMLIFYPFEKEDIDTLSVVYHQTLYDVLTGKHPLEEKKIVALAAYQLINEYGDDEDEAEKKVNDSIQQLIPANKISLLSEDQWKYNIMEQYKQAKSITKNEAKWNYIQELKTLTTFQVQQFNAKFNYQKSGQNDDDIPDKCVIGLKPEGIIILDRERNEIVFYNYESIMNWGISRSQLVLCISTQMNETKRICFFTSQTKIIQTLIETYCNLMVGKTMNDVQEIVQGYDKKFESIDASRRTSELMYKEEGGDMPEDVLGINVGDDEDEKKIEEEKNPEGDGDTQQVKDEENY